eukprot:CAMPEP_0170653886 /NCGR_PEP_ID=MMETSP0224-20130122/47638_1 /TAXON_ID=285029 /ORGANISM="Togula jolla, Strain CCCM 725" /LENGTH=342 /DNA_ID=CAMNT_0010985771 /DNA_START=62 /DNA_END=1091 /DNA_ORIENTATION=-
MEGSWGLISSELHNCDVFVDHTGLAPGCDSMDGDSAIKEDDFVVFDMGSDEWGLPAAHNMRRADVREVEQMQVRLAPLYGRHALRRQHVSDIPRWSAGSTAPVPMGTSTAATVVSAPSVTNGGVPPREPAVASTMPIEASLRRTPMLSAMPPPPTHPAPTGTSFAVQGHGMMQQYMQQPGGYASYPAYGCPDRGYTSVYTQGPWPGAAAAPPMRAPGTDMAFSSAFAGTSVEMLDGVDALATVGAALRSNAPLPRRGTTFRSSRSSVATQVGQDWCDALRQGVNCTMSMERERYEQMEQSVAANWVDNWEGRNHWHRDWIPGIDQGWGSSSPAQLGMMQGGQ